MKIFLLNFSINNLFISLIAVLVVTACNNNENAQSIKITPYVVKDLDTITTNSGLKYMMVKGNKNALTPKIGKKVNVHYTGYFTNGKIFDSSLQRNEPLSFTLGIGQVIKGWDEGIALLHAGERARFIIPYQLAYGIDGMGPIPPMSTLIFDVELISFEE
ncbi:MAG TPA: FKBP-type peptidyl-prolyl cis-trans isomerase [Bacteroidia bacterium]|nr:FKBP-type peptidyl-prolyl cis-trans isomerase [Bacteroidia bacterium]